MFQVKLVEPTASTDRDDQAPAREYTGTSGAQLETTSRTGSWPRRHRSSPPTTSGSTSAAHGSSPMSRSRSRRASSSGSSVRTGGREDDALQPPLGRVRPTAGRIELAGEDVTRDPPHRRTQAGLGRSFQVSSVFPLLPVEENVRLAAEAKLGGTLSPGRRAARYGPARSGRATRSRRSGSRTGRRGRRGCSRIGDKRSSRWRCSSQATRG